VITGFVRSSHRTTQPVVPFPLPSYTVPPLPTPAPLPTVAGSPQPPVGVYPREREELTDIELANYGDLHQGDCLDGRPGDLSQPAPTIDCSLPHTDQVMGFVDLSEGMPDIANIGSFEISVAQRCNSLKATLPIPEGFTFGVSATYPSQDEWDVGVRVALCWVPISNATWVGSAIDGTAAAI